MLGFVPQTPLLSTRGTRAQEWLPNLQLMPILGLKTRPSRDPMPKAQRLETMIVSLFISTDKSGGLYPAYFPVIQMNI